MKTVLVSQRVENIENYNERRDCLDQRWCGFLEACGYTPVPVMNCLRDIDSFIETLSPTGIILTGGNDLASYGGDAPERDATEKRLLEIGLANNIPIVGVCRGMQFLANYFGAVLYKVSGHVACRHEIHGKIELEVNSYHNFAVTRQPDGFEILAKADDGVIEAITCQGKKVLGIMWHPEREAPYKRVDVELFSGFIT